MDSSITELEEALKCLTDFGQHWSFDMSSGADAPGLASVYQACKRISETFNGANNDLSAGWETSARLFYKVYELVSDNLSAMYQGIQNFTNRNYQAELSASRALESANSSAEDVLSVLDALPLLGGGAASAVAAVPGVDKPGIHQDTGSPEEMTDSGTGNAHAGYVEKPGASEHLDSGTGGPEMVTDTGTGNAHAGYVDKPVSVDTAIPEAPVYMTDTGTGDPSGSDMPDFSDYLPQRPLNVI